MKCPKCSHLNEEDARFCSKCGYSLTEKKLDWNSIILLAYCSSLLFFSVLYLALKYVFSLTDANPAIINYVYLALVVIESLLTFVIPLGIKTLWMKIVAFILIAIAAIISISSNVTTFVKIINSTY